MTRDERHRAGRASVGCARGLRGGPLRNRSDVGPGTMRGARMISWGCSRGPRQPRILGMSGSVDLYQLLGVAPDAEACTIRAAYRRLAWRCHPDVGGSERAMSRLNTAWRTLRDPESRALYDGWRLGLKSKTTAPPAAPAPPRAHLGDRPAVAPTLGSSPIVGGTCAGAWNGRPPPVGRADKSTVMDFGRYEGWSLTQVAATDPDYLEWLARTSIGRRLQPEIAALLAARRSAASARQGGPPQSGRTRSRWSRARPSAVR